MEKINVMIEINGVQTLVGDLMYDGDRNAGFAYTEEYLHRPGAVPVSISLPLQEERFSPLQTRNFFEGLLPEGFTRKSVARWMHLDEKDYISLLCGLGRECLGAVQVMDGDDGETASYEKLSMEQVRELAKEGVSRSALLVTKSHLSLTGASGKVGLYFDKENKEWYLPVGNAPSTHIVKQSHIRLNGIVTNEQLALMTAAGLGIDIPYSFIINTGKGRDEDVLFAVERYDRVFDGSPKHAGGLVCPLRLHQEDFAQALGIAAADKYEKTKKGYLREMFGVLRKYSANPIEDQIRLWRLTVFNYLLGNTDNHIKNFSLLYGKDLRSIRLAPAYDMISTTIYEESTREMAYYIGEECLIDRITEDSFRSAASEAGLGEKAAMRHFTDMCGRFEKALGDAADTLAQMGFEQAERIKEKILRTGGIRRML